MKYNSPYIILLLFLSAFSSCSKKVDLLANYKDAPIVYGLIDANDSITYLRIQKAFLSEGNIYDDAQIADSNVYDYKLDVSINTGNRLINFDTTTIHNKEDGTFFSPNMPIYYAVTKDLINIDQEIKLEVKNPKTGAIAKSTATIIDASGVEFIRPLFVVNLLEDFLIDFSTTENIRAYQLIVRYHYMEIHPTDTTTPVFKYTDLNYELDFSETPYGDEVIRHNFDADNFIENLYNNISPTAEIERYIGHIELLVETSEESFYQYYTSVQADNSVIAHGKYFSNIENGYGIFAGTSAKSRIIRIDQISKLYLRNLEGLNFIGSIPEEEK